MTGKIRWIAVSLTVATLWLTRPAQALPWGNGTDVPATRSESFLVVTWSWLASLWIGEEESGAGLQKDSGSLGDSGSHMDPNG